MTSHQGARFLRDFLALGLPGVRGISAREPPVGTFLVPHPAQRPPGPGLATSLVLQARWPAAGARPLARAARVATLSQQIGSGFTSHRGYRLWTTHPAAASSRNPPASRSASTRPCAPSSSITAARRTWPSASATATRPSANSSGSSAPAAPTASRPPFLRQAAGAVAGPPHPGGCPTPAPRHRRLPGPEPEPGPTPADAPRRAVPLRAPVGPAALRGPRAPGALPRLAHDPRPRGPPVRAGAQVVGQGAAQPHRRLQLRRGPRPVRRAERPAQEVLPDRLLLPHRAPAATGPVGRLGRGPGAAAVPPGQGLLPGLPPDPLPRRPGRPGAPLRQPPGQGGPERVDLLRAGE